MTAYNKAWVGALVTGLSTLLVNLDGGHLSPDEVISALIAAAVAALGVWAIPNAAPAAHKGGTQ